LYKYFIYKKKDSDITNVATSNTKKALKKVGVLGINENKYLPSAILKVKNARRDKTNVVIPLLKRARKHKRPITILMPPYKPATSEYPIASVT
jgi:hypothetical protein